MTEVILKDKFAPEGADHAADVDKVMRLVVAHQRGIAANDVTQAMLKRKYSNYKLVLSKSDNPFTEADFEAFLGATNPHRSENFARFVNVSKLPPSQINLKQMSPDWKPSAKMLDAFGTDNMPSKRVTFTGLKMMDIEGNWIDNMPLYVDAPDLDYSNPQNFMGYIAKYGFQFAVVLKKGDVRPFVNAQGHVFHGAALVATSNISIPIGGLLEQPFMPNVSTEVTQDDYESRKALFELNQKVSSRAAAISSITKTAELKKVEKVLDEIEKEDVESVFVEESTLQSLGISLERFNKTTVGKQQAAILATLADS